MAPCFSQVYRVLKQNSYCVSFYGWQHIEKLMTVWKLLGFHPVAHLVWQKRYPSNRGVVAHMHEQAFVLAKGYPPNPTLRFPDVLPWEYSGNRFHPTEKAVSVIERLIRAFSKLGDIVLDPFCGSGSTLLAARESGATTSALRKTRVLTTLSARGSPSRHRRRRRRKMRERNYSLNVKTMAYQKCKKCGSDEFCADIRTDEKGWERISEGDDEYLDVESIQCLECGEQNDLRHTH